MTLPTFSPREINKINIDEQFGSLSGLFIKTEEQGTILKSLGAGSSPPDKKTLISAPRNIKIINITHMHGSQINIDSISCVSNNEFWISGDDNVMRLYNHQGHIVKSIQTRSGNIPKDTAVTRSGDLVYTDPKHFTVSIVKNTQIHDLIRLRNRKPLYVCCSSLGDFLVVIQDLTDNKSKVMRYSGSTEEQDTQFNAKGECLYTFSGFLYRFRKNIVENKNFDICVADGMGKAIVVINHAGKLRYKYMRIPHPIGITTDSQGRILATDSFNNRIHILDQDGQFLCYIEKCDFTIPRVICVDDDDKLLVSDYYIRKMKNIQYCM